METIDVNKAEYQRLLHCRSTVEDGLKKLGLGEQEAADGEMQ